MVDPQRLVQALPKAELHMHVEGSLEPELMFLLAARNAISLPYRSPEELHEAYRFTSLQSFLDVYYAGLTVLRTERDFYDMTAAYMRRAHADNVLHAELFVSAQQHIRRGVSMGAVVEGIGAALDTARHELGMTSRLLISTQRQYDEADAFAMLEAVRPWRDRVAGIGLGGPEKPHPPRKFARVFDKARAEGWRTVAHAGEEGPAAYVAEALDVLKVERIDHGVRCTEDAALVARLAALGVPLTVCPVSNVKLRVFPDLAAHNLKQLLDAGVNVTVNSDDPSYFLAYVNDNYIECQRALGLRDEDLYTLARNSFTAAFLEDAERSGYLARLDAVYKRVVAFDGV